MAEPFLKLITAFAIGLQTKKETKLKLVTLTTIRLKTIRNKYIMKNTLRKFKYVGSEDYQIWDKYYTKNKVYKEAQKCEANGLIIVHCNLGKEWPKLLEENLFVLATKEEIIDQRILNALLIMVLIFRFMFLLIAAVSLYGALFVEGAKHHFVTFCICLILFLCTKKKDING